MIFEGSRYEHNPIVRVADSHGVIQPAIYPDPYVDEQEFGFSEYRTVEGDRLDILAFQAYGDPELWWLIARANPEVFYPENLAYGIELRIPVREVSY